MAVRIKALFDSEAVAKADRTTQTKVAQGRTQARAPLLLLRRPIERAAGFTYSALGLKRQMQQAPGPGRHNSAGFRQ